MTQPSGGRIGFFGHLRLALLALASACGVKTEKPAPEPDHGPGRPARSAIDAQVEGVEPEPTGFGAASFSELTAICDGYWDSLAQGEPDAGADSMDADSYSRYVNASNELAQRGREVLPWARARLKHADYEARELAAFIVGELAARGGLGSDLDTIIAELSELAVRPVDQDNKEAQANGAAIDALGKIGDKRAIPALRTVLESEDWNGDDNQYLAAEILGKIVGKPFADADDPPAAAREWLAQNP